METLYTLPSGSITVSDGKSLSGITQGDGSHLMGASITLNSNSWSTVNINDNDPDFEDNDTSQTLAAGTTYGGQFYASGTIVEAEYSITVRDPEGNTYQVVGLNLREPGGSNTYGTIEGLAFIGPVAGFPPIGVPLTVIDTGEGPGSNETPYGDYATPPCFASGTFITTAQGTKRVEELSVGDLVETADNGQQPIRWIGQITFTAEQLRTRANLVPVRLAQNCFGPDQPSQDLMVSPQHRVLFTGWRAELYFGTNEVLVPAKHLLNDTNILRHAPTEGVTYFHILFDRHEVIYANGLATESFLPGPETYRGLSDETQHELLELFPELEQSWNKFESARTCLKSHQVLPLIA
ncbi:Hint domain-containing protein [Falsihalocynthiibacter sp. SS001]|uniref:Hint domain-containing protein n=1 Tax=Falsihalocynthiibacter sp. SS001 TaxID=3349698 RepID=UPI0036D3D779